MDVDERFPQVTIPAPCSADWNRMSGDDRERFCESCGKHVHNLSAMGPDAIRSLAAKAVSGDEEVCGRIDHRQYAQLFASDHGLSTASRAGSYQTSIRWLMALVAMCGTVLGIIRLWLLDPDEPGPAVTPTPSRKSTWIMGKMVPTRQANCQIPASRF